MRTRRFATPRLPAEIVKEAFKTSKTIREVVRKQTDLSEEELDRLLDARKMTEV